MKYFKHLIFLTFLLSLNCQNIFSQNNCLVNKSFHTSSISNGLDNSILKIPLNFYFTTDSIVASFPIRSDGQYLAFKILKQKCSWDKDFKRGMSAYELALKDGDSILYPKLIIELKPERGLRIELLYPNDEKRIFSDQ